MFLVTSYCATNCPCAPSASALDQQAKRYRLPAYITCQVDTFRIDLDSAAWVHYLQARQKSLPPDDPKKNVNIIRGVESIKKREYSRVKALVERLHVRNRAAQQKLDTMLDRIEEQTGTRPDLEAEIHRLYGDGGRDSYLDQIRTELHGDEEAL